MADFDIRAWRAAHGLPERIDNPEVVEQATKLLRRDLTERLAEQRQQSQDRTEHRNADDGQCADAQPA